VSGCGKPARHSRDKYYGRTDTQATATLNQDDWSAYSAARFSFVVTTTTVVTICGGHKAAESVEQTDLPAIRDGERLIKQRRQRLLGQRAGENDTLRGGLGSHRRKLSIQRSLSSRRPLGESILRR